MLPAIAPFCDLIRRYPHALAGEVAARCIGEMIGPTASKISMERFQILGLLQRHCDGDDDAQINILRRMLLSSLPDLPHPASMTTNRTERTMNIDVTANEASRFYSILLKGRHLLPDGWIVAASDVRPAPEKKKNTKHRNTSSTADGPSPPPPPPTVTERGESKRHLMLISACAAELFHTKSKIVKLFDDCEDKALVAMFNVFRTTCDVGRRGLTIQDTRVARAMCVCGALVLQSALDVLMQRNKSFIWRQRRAALQIIGALATLDRDIAMYNVRRGRGERNGGRMRKDVPSIYDVRVDMVVIQDAVYRARQDKVNVVRNAASYALDSLDGMFRAKDGDISGSDEFISRGGDVGKDNTLERVVREVDNEVLETDRRSGNRQRAVPLPPPLPPSTIDRLSPSNTYGSKYNDGEAAVFQRDSARSTSARSTSARSTSASVSQHRIQAETSKNAEVDGELEAEDVFEEPSSFATLLATMSEEDTKELESAIESCMSLTTGGASQMSTVLSGWLDENAEDMVSGFMLSVMDDGNNLSSSFSLLPRRHAKRALLVLGSTLMDIISAFNQQRSSQLDVALCRMLRWIYAALNSNHWSADDVIHGNATWKSIRNSVQALSMSGSLFTRKTHAAKIYALLRSTVLLESHLSLFATERQDDSSDDGESGESGDDAYMY
jgi:hypothetical protein